jgi:hypothetical protein
LRQIKNHFNHQIPFLFSATYKGNQNPIALNFNSNGVLSIQLPQGPDTDSYNIYLFVNVIDDSLGTTVYNLPNPVQVKPNENLANELLGDILSNDPRSPFLSNLQSGNLNTIAKTIIGIASVFNIEQPSNSTAINSTNVIKQSILLSFKNI